MSTPDGPGAESWTPSDVPSGVLASPLVGDDPPRVGDFWLDARLTWAPSGVAYLGHGLDDTPVMIVLLSEGAANDAAARDRLAGEVNQLHADTVVARGGHGQHEGRLGHRFRSEDDDPVGPDDAPLAPWVALAYDGSPAAIAEANRILASVQLARLAPKGNPSGPDYQLDWIDKEKPGLWRLWPLPWPGRHDRAGWITILVSWLLMILLAATALLIAVLLFQNQPPQPPQPPVPTNASQSSSPQSGSPTSGSPTSGSPSSGSPSSSGSSSGSPSSASASGSSASSPGTNGGHPSDNPSMESQNPSGSASGLKGSPTPNKKL